MLRNRFSIVAIVHVVLIAAFLGYFVYNGANPYGPNTFTGAIISNSMMHEDEGWKVYFENAAARQETLSKYGISTPDNSQTFDASQFPIQSGFGRGDILVAKKLSSSEIAELEVGDVIWFTRELSTPLPHRILAKNTENGEVRFTTKGDHNGPPYSTVEILPDDKEVAATQITGEVIAVSSLNEILGYQAMLITPIAISGVILVYYLITLNSKLSYVISFLGGLAAVPLALLIGIGVFVSLGVESIFLQTTVPGLITVFVILSATAGLTEEPLKIVGLAILAKKFPKRINSKRVGILCGAMAGLGFGAIEYIFRLLLFPSSLAALGGLTISLPLHMMLSALAGLGIYFFSSKRDKPNRWVWLFAFLALAIVIHTAFDFAVFWFALFG